MNTLIKSPKRRQPPAVSTERLLRGAALTLLAVLAFYLKVLSAVVRFGIKAVTNAGRRNDARGYVGTFPDERRDRA